VTARAKVESALARLREAGAVLRAGSLAEVHRALGDVLDAWRAPGSPWQAELVQRLPACTGFSPETVRRGLALGLAPYGGEALRELVRSELGGPPGLDPAASAYWAGFETTAAVLAGAIPLPTVVSIVAPLALGSPVLVKPSAFDPVTTPLLVRALAERMPALGECVEVIDFRRDDEGALDALCCADCVVATGSDEAVAALGARVRGERRFVAHGHRYSVALIGALDDGHALLRAARGLALDVALWDQLGCLSPVAVYVLDDPALARRLAEALATALAALERRMPRGRIAPAAAALVTRERAEAEMRAAASDAEASVHAGPGTSWTVVCETGLARRPAPLHRFVRVQCVDAGVLETLRGEPLAAVAVAGDEPTRRALSGALAESGVSRICAPGRLQTPPLEWPRGGLGVLTSLARRIGHDRDGRAR
jgi:hypothetical protein